MVVLTLSRKINKAIGPFLLRNGVALRYALGRGVVADNSTLDSLLLINLAQRLISLEVHDDSQKAIQDSQRHQSALDEWAEKTFDGIFGKSEEEERRKKMSDSELRVDVLENYLRPALVKHEKWSDVAKWQFHHRLLKWARKEFLLAKYQPTLHEALAAFPKLRYSPQLTAHSSRRQSSVLPLVMKGSEKEQDTASTPTSPLPQTALVEKVLEMQNWKKTKDVTAGQGHLRRLAKQLGGDILELRGGSLRFANIPMDADLSALTLEEILEVATGGHVSSCGNLNALCEERDIYQLWTKEYVDLLADYLMKRTQQFPGETVILDVGAGDGLLAKYLRLSMSEAIRGPWSSSSSQSGGANTYKRPHHRGKGPRQRSSSHRNSNKQQQKVPSIVAIDDGSWRILQKSDVQNISVEEALKQYSSDGNTQLIVLCSWMPMGVDWTSLFRKYDASEYILIGESDDGGCGDNWETWGNRAFLSDIGQELAEAMSASTEEDDAAVGNSQSESDTTRGEQSAVPAPFEIDGYKRIDIEDLVPYQFSRFDDASSRNGKTVTFKRQ